jgi:hypothetical protein
VSGRGTTLVRGHTLRGEGAAFARPREGWSSGDRRLYVGTGGPGVALCSCGASSDWLQSGAERRRWHAAHKQEMAS